MGTCIFLGLYNQDIPILS